MIYSLFIIEAVVKVSLPHNEDNSEVAKEFTAASMPLHIAVMLFELRIDEAELLVVEATAEVVEAVVVVRRHFGSSRPETVLHSLSRSFSNFLQI